MQNTHEQNLQDSPCFAESWFWPPKIAPPATGRRPITGRASCSSGAGPPSRGGSVSLALSLRQHLSLPRSPPLEPIQGISGVLSFDRRQPRSTGTAGPSLPRWKSVLATENCTSGHWSTTHNRTSPPAPPALAHYTVDRILSLSLSLGISLSLSDSISLSDSLSPPISLSRSSPLEPTLSLCLTVSR